MTRNEAVALVKQGLGFRTTFDSTIVTNMIGEQTKLELAPTKPWFLLSEFSTRETQVGEQRIGLPSDFLEEYEEGCLYLVDAETGEETPLVKDAYDVLRFSYKKSSRGAPQAYALTGNYFRLFPTPDKVYTLGMLYYKKALTLSTDVENEWLAHIPYLLIGKTGLAMAAALRDTNIVSFFNSMVSESMVLLESQNEARKHSNYDMQMGGPH